MSNEKKTEIEVETPAVVISAEDCKSAYDFWKHLEIPMPAELDNALKAFEKEPTLKNQDEVKFAICDAMVKSDHEAFKDEVFQKILEECGQVAYRMAFDRVLEKTLADKEDKN